MKHLEEKRYRLIQKYPGSHAIGSVYKESDKDKVAPFWDFPHLFQEMHWSELRAPEDMPEYVKKIKEGGYHIGGDILKTEWSYYGSTKEWKAICSGHTYPANMVIPSTKEDYEKFKNSGK